ncbi:hypothetical protein ACFQPA_13320 [Halomarina halobia]|uniref:Small CPxCG-related zinc finger protein n=1 Tax=Halomarina halobia TaxID=3033386 RepID=A0ABD6A8L8_9EURY|nr:hypothetical protein [Halomarina sp. PSR21]
MGLISTIRDALEPPERTSDRSDTESSGAYWCHDCGVRLLDAEVGSDDPACPECGEALTFERSPDSAGCAC